MNIKYFVLFSIFLISSTVQAQPFGSGGVQYIKPTGYLNESVGSRYFEIKCNVGEITHVLHKPKSNSGEVINQWLTGDQRQVLTFYAGATTEGFAQAACGSVNNAQSRVPNETAQSSSSVVSSTAIAPIATLDGNWYSSQWKYSYVLKDGVGVATSTNSPNFQVGQSIVRLTATSSTTFVGQQVYTDGKFYQVNAKLQTDGRLYFEGEKNVKWVMERTGAPPQVASPTRPSQGSVKEVTDEAVRLIRDKNYTNAEQLLRPLVAANNGYAQYLLGHIYDSAPPPLRNHVTAVELYTKSANQGFLVAMHALGLAYDNARGVVRDEAYAIEMYAKAASKNFGRSQYALGLKYAQGSGVEKNLDQAIDLLQRAANQNVAGAQQSLDQVRAAKQNAPPQATARVDLEELRAAKQNVPPQSTARVDNSGAAPRNSDQNRQNLNAGIDAINNENYTLAEKILAPMAINGDPKVQYALAVVYERSLPPLQNYSKSFELYSKAANSGDLDALYSLAMAYDEGRGTKKDEVQSTKLLIRAVDLGHRQAIVDLGLKYAEGRGVERNFDVALEMLRKAWTQNVEGAGKAYASAMKMKEDLDAEARRKQMLEQQRIAKIKQDERNKQEAARLEERRLAQVEAEKIAKAERDRVAKIEAEKNMLVFDKEYPQAPKSRGRITFTELGYFQSQEDAYSKRQELVAANTSTPFEMHTVRDGSLWRIVINNDVKHIDDKDYDEKIRPLIENLAFVQSNTAYESARLVSYTEGTLQKIRKNTRAFTQPIANVATQTAEFDFFSYILSWGIGIIVVAVLFGFVPAVIGYARGHSHRHIILLMCIFGAWTGLLWIAALIWSLWPMNKENSMTGIQTNPTHSEHKEPSERQNSNDKLSHSNQTDRTQEQASTTKASAPVRACWITLFIAWACFLIPIMGLGFVGAALASAASFISIIVMLKGQVGIGVIQFVLAVLFSPLLYFVGTWIWFMTLK
jgi:TPR repeat protein